jgi:hypothetical protein
MIRRLKTVAAPNLNPDFTLYDDSGVDSVISQETEGGRYQ